MPNLNSYVPKELLEEFNALRETIPRTEQPIPSEMLQQAMRSWIKKQKRESSDD